VTPSVCKRKRDVGFEPRKKHIETKCNQIMVFEEWELVMIVERSCCEVVEVYCPFFWGKFDRMFRFRPSQARRGRIGTRIAIIADLSRYRLLNRSVVIQVLVATRFYSRDVAY
jgi:hypothetical protein